MRPANKYEINCALAVYSLRAKSTENTRPIFRNFNRYDKKYIRTITLRRDRKKR